MARRNKIVDIATEIAEIVPGVSKDDWGASARAARCYIEHALLHIQPGRSGDHDTSVGPWVRNQLPKDYPYPMNSWTPQTIRDDLLWAAALIVAEIERLDRHG